MILDDEGRPDWHASAACKDVDTEVFFRALPPEGPGSTDRAEAEAKAICSTCPVRGECLDEAIANDERFGIFGGKNPKERGMLAAQRMGKRYRPDRTMTLVPDPQGCGSDAGYARHIRNREDTCRRCRDAHTLAQSLRKAERSVAS